MGHSQVQASPSTDEKLFNREGNKSEGRVQFKTESMVKASFNLGTLLISEPVSTVDKSTNTERVFAGTVEGARFVGTSSSLFTSCGGASRVGGYAVFSVSLGDRIVPATSLR